MLQIPAKPRRKIDALSSALDRLRQAISTDESRPEWADVLNATLTDVAAELRQRQSAVPTVEEHSADGARPTLTRQATGLRHDRLEILQQIISVRDELMRAKTAQPGIERSTHLRAIRQDAEAILVALQDNQEAEVKIVQEAVNTDIGGGD